MRMAIAKSLAWAALLLLSRSALAAPDISGIWQASGSPARVTQVAHEKGCGWRGQVNYLSDTAGTLNGNPVSITLSGQAVKFSFDRREDSFEGTLSADGKSITGLWRASSQVEGRTEPM